jgi:hypothetical protein
VASATSLLPQGFEEFGGAAEGASTETEFRAAGALKVRVVLPVGPTVSAMAGALDGAEDDEGHVVALGGASCESVGGLHDTGYGVTSGEAVAGGDRFG